MASQCSLSLLFLADLFAYSLPSILASAWTLYNKMGRIHCCSNSTNLVIIVLSKWLLYDVGCLICVLMTYRPLR